MDVDRKTVEADCARLLSAGMTDAEARILLRIFDSAFSAISARSSESSNCACSCLYLPKFVAATSSCKFKGTMTKCFRDAETYSLLNLSLEDLEFGLEFVDELGESLSVLLVLLDLELDLLDTSFGLAPVLVGILVASEN